jgi:hypothetical protein
MNILSICKKISALCKKAARVIYDYEAGEGALSDDFIYISEEHTVYKIPASVDVCAVFDKLFEARSAAGCHGMDIMNEGTAKKCYESQYKEGARIRFTVSEKITAEVLTVGGSLKAGWRFLDDPDSGAFRAVNTKFLDVFTGFEYIATADDKRSNYPFFVSVPDENITALILPFSMDRSTAEAAIKKAAEKAEADAEKIKGVYFDGGIYSAFIADGRKDRRTAEKIIRYLASAHGWTEETTAEALNNPAMIDSMKEKLINVTAEEKTRENGEKYFIFYDKKTFFRSEAAEYTKIDGVLYTFYLGKDRDAMKAADQAAEEPAPAVETVKTEPAPAEAAEDITTEPAEDIPADAIQEPTTGPAEAADDPADQEPSATPEALNIEDITPENYTEFLYSLFGKDNHNASIIMLAGFEAGIYKYPDLMNYLSDGTTPNYHTFDHWKNAGYMVKKGEKAAFSADIWKYTEKHGTMTAEEAAAINAVMIDPEKGPAKEGDQTTTSKYILKKSFFFGPAQVEKIEKKPFTAPEGCELKTENGREILTGDTKPHKDAIKNAGFYWHKTNNYWYRTA